LISARIPAVRVAGVTRPTRCELLLPHTLQQGPASQPRGDGPAGGDDTSPGISAAAVNADLEEPAEVGADVAGAVATAEEQPAGSDEGASASADGAGFGEEREDPEHDAADGAPEEAAAPAPPPQGVDAGSAPGSAEGASGDASLPWPETAGAGTSEAAAAAAAEEWRTGSGAQQQGATGLGASYLVAGGARAFGETCLVRTWPTNPFRGPRRRLRRPRPTALCGPAGERRLGPRRRRRPQRALTQDD
jgi:hypothetical protein